MASELVERLRGYRSLNDWGDGARHTICDEAADRITALEAEVAQAYARGLEDAAKVVETHMQAVAEPAWGIRLANRIRALDPQGEG